MSDSHYKSAWENTLDHYNADTLKWRNEIQELKERVSFAEIRLEMLQGDARVCAVECHRLRREKPDYIPEGCDLYYAIDRILETTKDA